MKKIIIAVLLSAKMLLVCGCGAIIAYKPAESAAAPTSQANEEVLPVSAVPEPADPPDPNSEKIYSLIERMQSNKAVNSFEGFTGESTVIDIVDKAGADNIMRAVLSYKSELVGYPAVVQYIFDNYRGGTLALTSMYFFIMPEQRSGYKKQLQELADKLEAGLGGESHVEALGDHELGNKYPDYSWKRVNYSIVLSSEGDYTSSGALAFVHFTPFNDSDMPDIFPDIAAGTDIHTVYGSETPAPGLEDLTLDPFTYNMCYTDKGIPVNLIFKVQGTEIKLCQAEYGVLLPDTGYEDIDKCFKSFGDSMEDIFGPAALRDDSLLN